MIRFLQLLVKKKFHISKLYLQYINIIMIMSAVHLHGGLLYCIPMVIPNANFAIGNSYRSPFNSSVKKGTCRKTGFSA